VEELVVDAKKQREFDLSFRDDQDDRHRCVRRTLPVKL
jgi:hypothetical protein